MYSTCPTTPNNAIGNEIITANYALNKFPIKSVNNKTFYVGGANASDTEDLFNGRGETPDKPFATLMTCVNFVTVNYLINNTAYIILQSDQVIENWGYVAKNIYNVKITSDSTQRTITFRKDWGVQILDGNIEFNNVNFKLENITSLWCHRKTLLILSGKIAVSGSTNRAFLVAETGDVSIYVNADFTGSSLTGRRYEVGAGSRIIVGGRGENYLPGTEAGICSPYGLYF